MVGSSQNPMKNILFDNVVVKNPGLRPWGDKYYACSNIEGIARGDTQPVPPCFKHYKQLQWIKMNSELSNNVMFR